MKHHLYSLSPLTSLSVDTLGPLKEDENGNSFVIVKLWIIFPKLLDYIRQRVRPPRNISMHFYHGYHFWCSERDPKRRSFAVYVQDGSGHSIITPLQPFSCNGVSSRSQRNKRGDETPTSLVYEKRIRDSWSHYLPFVQRIINYTVDRSIETQPARVIFGDLEL